MRDYHSAHEVRFVEHVVVVTERDIMHEGSEGGKDRIHYSRFHVFGDVFCCNREHFWQAFRHLRCRFCLNVVANTSWFCHDVFDKRIDNE